MRVGVPSLENTLYLEDPLSIIAYQIRRYQNTPKETVPLLPDLIISLPWQVSRFSAEPENLVSNIQSDLQSVFDRIFAGTRMVKVNTTYVMTDVINYDVTITVLYSLNNGEVTQTGAVISLVGGQLKIPEDTVQNLLGSVNQVGGS